MRTWRGHWLLLTVVIAAVLSPAGRATSLPDEVKVTRIDVDGDGVAEIVLENGLIRVEIMTGVSPQPEQAGWWERTFRTNPKPGKPKYGTRFVGPGWIHNVVSTFSGRRWFVNDAEKGRHWHGIPEEFDEAVRMVEVEPGVWHCLKIGVGVCRGTGLCTRGTLSLIDPGIWKTAVETLPDGGRTVTFIQTVDTEYGYAYTYRKSIALRPRQARFVTSRRLDNRGSKPLGTTWYTHAFWGQADAGNTYDDACWATIPMVSLTAGAAAPANTDPCVVSNHPPGHYWGAIAGAAIGGNWYACGHSTAGDVFLSAFSRKPDFYRVWSYANTYSCEPFQIIDLKPGETFSWDDLRACGRGLKRIDGHDGGRAAFALDTINASTGAPSASEAVLRVCPFEPIDKGSVRIRITRPDGQVETLRHPLDSCVAGTAVAVRLKCAPETIKTVSAHLTIGTDEASTGSFDAEADGMHFRPRWPVPLPAAPEDAHAVIFAELKRGADGALIPDRASAYLLDYLLKAGFSVSLANPRENWRTVDWDNADVILFSGLGRLSRDQVRHLEEAVAAGVGLVVCGPLDLRAFEFSSLLPASTVLSSVEQLGSPRDCTREFVGASQRRYHLEQVTPHPATTGMPLFPDAYQDIGRLQIVAARPGATTVLRYHSPKGILPATFAPALLVGSHGRGRVALLTCPVDWGLPAQWCIWGRVGEYHRKLLAQIALWACQAEPTR